ncbi:PREDICTED: uncharacterized protein LOC104820692 [Tarenaya hassleriana]|uniref:uncharacterized protein LOC104820692 n=1 Tax=Tarenaya hassleriana TaxID=28532 RepID=UPI00053C62ED|nr:PREDICTED: uncharacterized protein LOC104820692 [Tarenaya hassleriana]
MELYNGPYWAIMPPFQAGHVFWYDVWTDLGVLLDYIGLDGLKLARLHKSATVSDVVEGDGWKLPPARSPRIQELHIALAGKEAAKQSHGADCYLWKCADSKFTKSFSTKSTWKLLRLRSPKVHWYNLVWFKQSFPRYAFLLWQVHHLFGSMENLYPTNLDFTTI